MSDKPASPFARLDTSLLRSTKPQEAVTPALTAATPAPTPVTATDEPARDSADQASSSEPTRAATVARHRDTSTPRSRDTTVETKTPRHRDTTSVQSDSEVVESVRKVVKAVGKEGATLRLTLAEKQQLKDMVYTYSRQGKRTSETELIRIATNYMLEDYRRNGETSIVARVIAALES